MQSSIPWSSSVSVSVVERKAIIQVYCAVFIGCTTAVTSCHSLIFVVTRCITRYHSLSRVAPLALTRFHSLSLVVIRCHSLYHSLYHSFLLVVPFVVTRCHSLTLVVTRCTTRLSFYKRSKTFIFNILNNAQ